jgi:hypothetical protein
MYADRALITGDTQRIGTATDKKLVKAGCAEVLGENGK